MTAHQAPAPRLAPTEHEHFRMTKILATLGPSSSSEEEIYALAAAGASGFRLNFSHGTLADHQARAAAVRAVEQRLGKPLALLMDLQGPKIRVGEVSAPVRLVDGEPLVLDSNPAAGDSLRVCLPHEAILASLQAGDTVLVNDGVIRLLVRETGTDDFGPRAVTEVVAGGVLSSRKGVNVPGRTLPMGALTPKDEKDLMGGLALKEEVDWVALSFVQTAADIEDAKARIAQLTKRRVRVMAKIETQAAVDNLVEIVAVCDGIMVARGDLGVELPTEDVPPLQKHIVELCRAAGKPVVVATQMVESMVQNPRPTRAEASDVANAACEGADCVMLSAESASGAYPVAAVEAMAKIIAKVEQSPVWAPGLRQSGRGVPENFDTAGAADAVALAASQMALALGAAGLVTFTETGQSTLRLSRLRSVFDGEDGGRIAGLPIIALTPHRAVTRALAIGWGIRGIPCPPVTDVEDMVAKAASTTHAAGLAVTGAQLVVVAGIPFGQAGSTNLVRIVDASAGA